MSARPPWRKVNLTLTRIALTTLLSYRTDSRDSKLSIDVLFRDATGHRLDKQAHERLHHGPSLPAMSALRRFPPFRALPLQRPLSRAKQTYCSCHFNWWSRGGPNSRPPHCERDALPAELRPHTEQVVYTRVATHNHAIPAPESGLNHRLVTFPDLNQPIQVGFASAVVRVAV